MAMAGLWSIWRDPGTGDWVPSCSVITTTAIPCLAAVHDRMPLLLEPELWSTWLGPDSDPRDILAETLATLSADGLEVFPVSRLVKTFVTRVLSSSSRSPSSKATLCR